MILQGEVLDVETRRVGQGSDSYEVSTAYVLDGREVVEALVPASYQEQHGLPSVGESGAWRVGVSVRQGTGRYPARLSVALVGRAGDRVI